MVEIALISDVSRGDETVFGRTILERAILMCGRAGITRFFVQCRPEKRASLEELVAPLRDGRELHFVDSLGDVLQPAFGLSRSTPCLSLSGNVVFGRWQLNEIIDEFGDDQNSIIKRTSVGGDLNASIALGPLAPLISAVNNGNMPWMAVGLPFALDGHPQDREEAEKRIARTLRHESAATDGLMARILDRRISWRISYYLAQTGITPNQITIANTFLGLFSAYLFAMPGYLMRLIASLLFLASITIDGVDGEVARLKMVESEAGRRLDIFTDNVVHVAIFIGLSVGCYRAGGGAQFIYLLPILLGGFAMCAVSVQHALRVKGAQAEAWIEQVERVAGRDFAYLLVILAATNHLELFVWGTAFGTYVFATVLWWLSGRRNSSDS